MAKPIEETPVLRGKDAIAFIAAIKANESKTISSDHYYRIQNSEENLRTKINQNKNKIKPA